MDIYDDVSFKFGSQASYDALSVKDELALYFILDKHRIYRGANLVAEANPQVEFVTTLPAVDDMEPEKLYVVTEGTDAGIYIKQEGETEPKPIGGNTVANGGITSIEAFDDAILDKAPVEGEENTGLSADDSHVPTSGAVKAAIEEALKPYETALTGVDVQQGTDDGTVITFTDAQGNEKTVTIADLFLSGAEYDPETHILSLNVSGQEAPVTVDLSDLVPQTVTSSQVALGGEIVATADVGGVKAGDKFDASNTESLQDLLKAILSADHNPTTTQPKASVVLTGAGALEVGTIFTPQFQASLDAGEYSANQNGAQPTGVEATAFSITDTDGNTASTATGSLPTFTVADNTNYHINAAIDHSAGAVPTTYLGQEYPAGQITAGSKSATSLAVTGYRPVFFGALAGKGSTISSALIRALGKSTSKAIKGSTYTVPVPAGSLRVVVAFEASLGNVASITSTEEFNAEIKNSFTQMTVEVDDASGANPISYNVYVKDMAVAQEATTTYTVTI